MRARKRNPIARAARAMRLRVVRPRKGKGSYTRKGKAAPR